MKSSTRHCAIYTRKSSEEGLEQDFNTLDAQREACQAFIASQKSEGWTAVKEHYDDGGFSGGNMDRPALKKLMDDIRAGKVHIVVVYKIDRLTRSLMDFAKLVEVFDAHGVTFVSVTQSFNTTTSMGRLTLNVLLSFAQFEREVAGERIRDKIAASKKKGMWMGGTVPLGYNVKDRALVVNEKEAALVRHIFDRYLAVGCVRQLKAEIDAAGITNKSGSSLSRGTLYWLLQNPVYLGQTRHKGQVYAGQHSPIIDANIWNNVQQKMQDQSVNLRGQKCRPQNHLLQGLLYDVDGVRYTPVFTTKKSKRYRYYSSQNVIQCRDHTNGAIARIPAQEIEDFIEQQMRATLSDTRKIAEVSSIDHTEKYEALKSAAQKSGGMKASEVFSLLKKAVISPDNITLEIDLGKLKLPVAKITIPFQSRKSWRGAVVIQPASAGSKDTIDLPPHELHDLIRGIIWRDEHFNGMTIRDLAAREGHSEVFVGRLIHRTFNR
jgi:site-specific DNA recombinase